MNCLEMEGVSRHKDGIQLRNQAGHVLLRPELRSLGQFGLRAQQDSHLRNQHLEPLTRVESWQRDVWRALSRAS